MVEAAGIEPASINP